MSELKLIPADEERFSLLITFYNELFPHETRPPDYYELREAQRPPGAYFQSYFIQVDDEDAGFYELGTAPLSDDPARFVCGIYLLPGFQRKGYGRKCLEKIESEARRRKANALTVIDATAKTVGFFQRRGYNVTLEVVDSSLELKQTNLSALPDPSLPRGFRIVSFAELKSSHGEKVYALLAPLVRQVMHDIPGSREAAQTVDAAMLERTWSDGRNRFWAEGCLFVFEGETPVAVHNLWRLDEAALTAGVTGVLPGYRRRGIAIALKVRGLQLAASHGFRKFISNNQKDNPMLQLNQKLGFKEVGRTFELEKLLVTQSG